MCDQQAASFLHARWLSAARQAAAAAACAGREARLCDVRSAAVAAARECRMPERAAYVCAAAATTTAAAAAQQQQHGCVRWLPAQRSTAASCACMYEAEHKTTGCRLCRRCRCCCHHWDPLVFSSDSRPLALIRGAACALLPPTDCKVPATHSVGEIRTLKQRQGPIRCAQLRFASRR